MTTDIIGAEKSESAIALANFEFNSKVDEAFATHEKVRDAVQAILVFSARHVERHEDTRFLAYFIQQLDGGASKGLNREAIVEWLNRYSWVKVKYNETLKKHETSLDKERTCKAADCASFKWWELKNKKNLTDYKAIDAANAVIGLHSKKAAEKKRYEDKGEHDKAAKIVTNSALMHALKALTINQQLVDAIVDGRITIIPKEEKEANAA